MDINRKNMSQDGPLSWYRGSIPPGSRSPLQLLMIQSTSFCNIDCSYCYLPLRSSKARFDLDRLPILIAKLEAAGLIDRELTFAWHAGEPLVLPVEWYRRAFAVAEAHVPEGVIVRHCFQTNAIMLSEDYARFFRETGASVGVSIDGPREWHDARRTTRDGKGTFERTMAGITRLREQQVPFTTISVLGTDALDQPDLIYDFFKSLGTIQAGFNVEEIEGENQNSSLAGAEMEAKVRAFYRRLAERTRTDPQPLAIREFDMGRGAALGALAGAAGGSSENNPLSIVSVDTEGRLATFSPELLQVPGQVDAWTFGTIESVDFPRLWQNNAFAAMHADIDKGIAMCRESCGYFDRCHGGAPANKLAENGTFISTETMHCRLSKQAVLDVMEDVLLTELQQRQAKRQGPATAEPKPLVRARGSGGPWASAPEANQEGRTSPAARTPRIVTSASAPRRGAAVVSAEMLRSIAPAGTTPVAAPIQRSRIEPASDRPDLNPLFPHLGTLNVFAPAERLAVTLGTRAPTPQEAGYKAEARVPTDDWWRLNSGEIVALASPTRSPGSLNYVALVVLPEALREAALDLGRTLAASQGPAGPRPSGASEEEFAEALSALFSPGRPPKLLGPLVQPGGLKTATLDPEDGKRQGLHVDSWSGRSPFERATAPNRLAVNVGAAPRRLLFLDLGLEQIAGLMGGGPTPLPANPTDLARAFLRLHPNYPVLSLEIRPGEAYIAATENIVHDGSSEGSVAVDATLTLLGEFRRADAAPHFIQATETAAR